MAEDEIDRPHIGPYEGTAGIFRKIKRANQDLKDRLAAQSTLVDLPKKIGVIEQSVIQPVDGKLAETTRIPLANELFRYPGESIERYTQRRLEAKGGLSGARTLPPSFETTPAPQKKKRERRPRDYKPEGSALNRTPLTHEKGKLAGGIYNK